MTINSSNTNLTSSQRLRDIGRVLRQKTTTHLVFCLLILICINLLLGIVRGTNQNLIQIHAKTELRQGFKNLTPCIVKPIDDYDICLKSLSVVSKALDTYQGITPDEAIAWGAAQTFLFSLKSEQYSDIHKELVKWAILEKYISNASDTNTPKLLRDALKVSYLAHVEK